MHIADSSYSVGGSISTETLKAIMLVNSIYIQLGDKIQTVIIYEEN